MFTGTHKGGTGTVLSDPGVCFRSLGVDPSLGQYCENETQGTGAAVTAATEDTVTAGSLSFDAGDTYNIYKTATKNSFISRTWTDASRGWKAERKDLGKDGWLIDDIDIDDKGRKKVFGPGFPEK